MNLAGQDERRGPVRRAPAGCRGYAMAALLVSLGVLAILMTAAMPVWRQAAQREKEEELVFRGKQYARAIGLFGKKYANAFPPNVDVLVEQRFLRKKYTDPMSEDGEFQILYQSFQTPAAGAGQNPASQGGRPGTSGSPSTTFTSVRGSSPSTSLSGAIGSAGPRGGIIGVTSKSKEKSIRLYNGRSRYNEWQFVYTPVTLQPGAAPGGGTQRPGQTPTSQQEGPGGIRRPGQFPPTTPPGPGSFGNPLRPPPPPPGSRPIRPPQ